MSQRTQTHAGTHVSVHRNPPGLVEHWGQGPGLEAPLGLCEIHVGTFWRVSVTCFSVSVSVSTSAPPTHTLIVFLSV